MDRSLIDSYPVFRLHVSSCKYYYPEHIETVFLDKQFAA